MNVEPLSCLSSKFFFFVSPRASIKMLPRHRAFASPPGDEKQVEMSLGVQNSYAGRRFFIWRPTKIGWMRLD